MNRQANLFLDALRNFIFFRPSPGMRLITVGATLLVLLLAGFAMSVGIPTENGRFDFSFDSSGDVSSVAFSVILSVAVLLIAIGVIRLVLDMMGEARKRVIAIEIRGLRDTSGQPLSAAIPKRIKGRREQLPLDIRQGADGKVRSPEDALEIIQSLPHSLRHMESGVNRSDISRVAAGLASVPFSFLTGVLLDDEGAVELMDWDRTSDNWRELDEPDDGERFKIAGLDTVGDASEVVLAIALSYSVDKQAIAQTFPGIPVVEMTLSTQTTSGHWSATKQAAWATQFFDTARHFCGTKVNVIHLVLAAPNSVVLRFGRAYDKRNLPEVIVYQYENGHPARYPWGVRMPVAGVTNATIINR